MAEAARETQARPSGHFLDDLRTTIANRRGEAAVCFQDRSFTYEDLDRGARCWARTLREAGVQPGDCVAITTPEKVRFLTAHLGTLYAAGVSLRASAYQSP